MISIRRAVIAAVGFCFVALPPLSHGQTTSVRAQRRTPIVEVFEKTRDAVVNISCRQTVERDAGSADPFENFFNFGSPFGPRERRPVVSVGSGFVLHADGYVVTNAHVVLKTVDQQVIFADGKSFKARPVAIDTDRDLAVLKIDADHPLPALPLGRSDDLMIGETVIAIGNPLGYQHTLTTGIVSAVDRELRFPNGVVYKGLVQTDASINPGNSGGPLLNILGELIGINSAIRGDAQNIGFAIPVDALRRALPNMLSLERLKRVSVGMRIAGYDRVEVVSVQEHTPAFEAGIQPGDRVLRVGDRAVPHDVDFYIDLLSKKAGDRLVLQLQRGGQRVHAVLTLKAIPIPDGAKLARGRFGLQIEPLSAELAKDLEIPGGLIVTGVDLGGPADRAGLRRGMIIVTIADDYPRDLDHVGLLLENVRPGDAVAFRVWRINGRIVTMYPPVKLVAQ